MGLKKLLIFELASIHGSGGHGSGLRLVAEVLDGHDSTQESDGEHGEVEVGSEDIAGDKERVELVDRHEGEQDRETGDGQHACGDGETVGEPLRHEGVDGLDRLLAKGEHDDHGQSALEEEPQVRKEARGEHLVVLALDGIAANDLDFNINT